MVGYHTLRTPQSGDPYLRPTRRRRKRVLIFSGGKESSLDLGSFGDSDILPSVYRTSWSGRVTSGHTRSGGLWSSLEEIHHRGQWTGTSQLVPGLSVSIEVIRFNMSPLRSVPKL